MTAEPTDKPAAVDRAQKPSVDRGAEGTAHTALAAGKTLAGEDPG